MKLKVCRVIKGYRSMSSDPIVLKEGESAVVGRRYDEDPDWEDWIWCESENGKKRWVPKQKIKIIGNTGIVLNDYFVDELSAK